MEKTKIVHLIGTLSIGGAERFVVDLCNELAKTDAYEIYLVSLRDNDPKNTFVQDIDPKVKYISFNKGPGFSFSVLFKFSRWLKEINPDIVHSHLNTLEYLILNIIGNKHTLFLHTLHGVAKMECRYFLMKQYRRILYAFNKVKPITISLNGSKTFRAYYKLENETLIANGRPDIRPGAQYDYLLHKYKLKSDDFLLVHAGRIVPEKNQQLLIRAVQQFNSKAEKKCKLLMLGEVQGEVAYRELLRLAGNDPAIEFLGGVPNVTDYLYIADAFCLSSTHEGMPISLIEALSVGCIPVSTPAGGIPQMISHGHSGFLSKGYSTEEYVDALETALYYRDKSLIKMNAVVAFKMKYHISVSADIHSRTYTRLLEEVRNGKKTKP